MNETCAACGLPFKTDTMECRTLLPEDVIVDEKGDVTMRGKDKRFVDHRAAMQAARDADRAEREAIEGDAAEADAVDEAEGSRRAAAAQRDEEEEAWWRGQVEGR